nr:hypothetical protein [Pseudomonas aeruginosa]
MPSGLSVNGFVNVPNIRGLFFMLDPFESRTSADLGARVSGACKPGFASIPDSSSGSSAAASTGLGTIGGSKMQVEDRNGAGLETLARQTRV